MTSPSRATRSMREFCRAKGSPGVDASRLRPNSSLRTCPSPCRRRSVAASVPQAGGDVQHPGRSGPLPLRGRRLAPRFGAMTAEPGPEPSFDLDLYLSLPRVARSAPGESGAAFLPDGSLLFTSPRADPEAAPDAKDDGEVAGLWLLPAGGGEARPVASTPAGIDLVRVARDAGTVVYRSGAHPGADDLEADERR